VRARQHAAPPRDDAMNDSGAVPDASRLGESEERLRVALSAGHLGDWRWDAADDRVHLSPRAAEIFGVAPGQPVTWTALRGLLHKDDAEGARLAVEKALAERSDYDIEYRVTRPSGEPCWIAAKGRGTYQADGAVTGMIGIVQDITGRRRAEEALLDTQARLNMALESGQMGTWEWSVASGRVTWSPALERIHGLAPGTFGGSFDDFQRDIHPEDRERVLAAIRATIESRADYRVEYRIVKPDGSQAFAWTPPCASRRKKRCATKPPSSSSSTAPAPPSPPSSTCSRWCRP
jgi:PAS domain S-box-containing protein